jgi:hypothetical protein
MVSGVAAAAAGNQRGSPIDNGTGLVALQKSARQRLAVTQA